MNAKFSIFAASLMMVAGSVQAAITDVSFSKFGDQAEVDSLLGAGWVVNDVLVDVTGNIRGQAMILELTSGSIYQVATNEGGANIAPAPFAINFVPKLKFDTFVTLGGATSDLSAELIIAGGAVNIDPAAQSKFDTTGINFSWAPGTGVNVGNMDGFQTARITLSSDATGTFRYFGSTEGEDVGGIQTHTFSVVNGVIDGGIVNDPVFESDPAPNGLLDFGYGGQNRTLSLATRNTGGGTIQVANFSITGADADLFNVNNFAAYGLDGPDGAESLEVEFLAEVSGGPGTYNARLSLLDAGGAEIAGYNLTAQVPEPSTVALAGLGLVGLVGFVRRRG